MPSQSILSRAKALYRRLAPSIARDQPPYRPDFSAAWASRAVPSNAPNDSAGTGTVEGSLGAGIARAFRNRQTPNFFIAGNQLAKLCAAPDAAQPDILKPTLRWANDAVLHNLDSYSFGLGPLNQGLDWAGVALGPGDDVLYPARPHRFAFAPKLALAALCNAEHESLLAQIIQSWQGFAQSGKSKLPYLSNLSVTQRFIALSWAWAFLSARQEETVTDDFSLEFEILKILRADAWFLIPRLGDSYPNNHLLADGFIGWYIGTLFPEFVPDPEQSPAWEELWLQEFRRQVYEDGTSLEHSTHYHEFACEMAVAYILLSRLNNREPAGWMVERTRRMLEFQIALGGLSGSPLHIGDATDDPIFPLEADERWAAGAMRELYRALFDPSLAPAPSDAPGVATAFWLLGGKLEPSPQRATAGPLCSAFEDGGYYVFRDDILDAHMVFRSGPAFGIPVLGGHMHADLMSVYMSLAGAPWIVDSGTYTYKAASSWPPDSSHWRSYFMGPKAHNGLSIGDDDPLGAVDGNFREMNIAARVKSRPLVDGKIASLVESEMTDAGAYSGWRRGVVHLPGHYWVIYDSVSNCVSNSENPGEAFFGFQFAADVSLESQPNAGTIVASGNTSTLVLQSSGLDTPKIFSGSLDPAAGWISMRYGHRQAAPQVRYPCRPSAAASKAATAFLIKPQSDDQPAAGIEVFEDSEHAFRITAGETTDYLLLPPTDGPQRLHAWGIEFSGRLMWLRTVGAKPKALRCLSLVDLSARAYGLHIAVQKPIEALQVSFTTEGPVIELCTSQAPNIILD